MDEQFALPALHVARAILVESLADIDARIAGLDADPAPVLPPDPASRSGFARMAGFTGDTCPTCGGAAMRRTGPCLCCTDCGATTGCS